jgi:signal transduction histidine kinase
MVPRWAQSIRFRLSLAYALAVFAAGSILVAGVYLWQLRQLDEPILVQAETVTILHPDTREPVGYRYFFSNSALADAYMTQFERQAYRQSLEELRHASLVGLGILFVVAFGTGWLLAGWTLRPMGRMVAVVRDISGTELSRRIGLRGPDDELKGLADTFDDMLDRLQASFEDQRRFIQDTSHELRNPLAVTQANLELVIDDADASPEELRQAARIAHASTGRMAKVVDELVDQARQGLPPGQASVVDLHWLARDVAAEAAAGAQARNLALVVEPGTADGVRAAGPGAGAEGDGRTTSGSAGSDLQVRGDQAALRRALTNLVANAVRLAPAGTAITIGVRPGGDGTVRLSVSDEGPGIEPDERDLIFQRFHRGRASGDGLGLGLDIVGQIVERHGGRVELETQPGEGSTFTLVLPTPVRR